MSSGDNDILNDIAEVLTCKIKKELVLSLAPYREKINNGEKYEKVLKLLETLPEYVQLRDGYNRLLEENNRLKQNNIVLQLNEKEEEEALNNVEMINNIEGVCTEDENVVLDDVEKKTVYLTNTLQSRIEDKISPITQEEEEEVTDDEQEGKKK